MSLASMGTVNILGTGGLIEGDLQNSNVAVNLDPVLFSDPTAGASYDKPYVYIPDISDMDSNNFTLSAWIRIPDMGSLGSSNWIGGCDNGYLYGVNNHSVLKCEIRDTSHSAGPSAGTHALAFNTAIDQLGPDTWHHVAIVCSTVGSNATTVTAYVDGIAEATVHTINNAHGDNQIQPAGTGAGGLFRKGADDSDFFDGYIADVKWYDAALTAPQIQTLASKINIHYDAGAKPAGNTALQG